MPSAKPSRKRQTRLSFLPAASSFPEASNLSASVKARAAVVRYKDLNKPSKRRKLGTEDLIESEEEPAHEDTSPRSLGHLHELLRLSRRDRRYGEANGGLPTPERSSQIVIGQRRRQEPTRSPFSFKGGNMQRFIPSQNKDHEQPFEFYSTTYPGYFKALTEPRSPFFTTENRATSPSSEDSSLGMTNRRPSFFGRDRTPMSQRKDTKRDATDFLRHTSTPSKKTSTNETPESPSTRTPPRKLSKPQRPLFTTPTKRRASRSPELSSSSDSVTDTIALRNEIKDSSGDESDDDDDIRLPSERKRQASKPIVISSGEDPTTDPGSENEDSDDVVHMSGGRHSTRSTPQKSTPMRTRSQTAAVSPSPATRSSTRVTRSSARLSANPYSAKQPNKVSSSSEESDQDFPSIEDIIATKPKSQHRTRSSKKQVDLFQEDSGNDLPSSRGRLTAVRNPKTPTRKQPELSQPDEEESETLEEAILSSRRKRLVRRKSIAHPAPSPSPSTSPKPALRRSGRRDNRDEVLEDVADLEDNEVRQTRTRGKGKPSQRDARLKQLEVMKSQRQRREQGIDDSELDIIPNEDDASAYSEVDDSSEDDRRVEELKRTLRSNEDDYETDFVVEDDGETQDLVEIPIEFTRHANKSLKEHFKDVVEWMVHKKLNKAFARNDPVYVIAFRKVGDEIGGLAGSKFISSAWKEDFQHALKARPKWDEMEESAGALLLGCQACGRSSHPATFRLKFSGRAYNPETLDDLKEDEKDDDGNGDDDDDTQSFDFNGNPLPDQEREFYVGRHCKSNASIAHSLLHWRWLLNDWILDWLERQRYLTNERVLERAQWSDKRCENYANKIVDDMVDEVIPDLWRDLRNVTRNARDRKVAAFGRVGEIVR